ncbi:methyltransferase domain-containing protein [Microbispora hainanensis]|jgi:SAM-dependent methyltransferase|uniref:Methyltransferase domain-containing protein n=1 Tax=Microbispora hainanensis TaxID=568844 RepID=A0ABZ1SL38_9ACTN|nr:MULTISPECIES: class I SAM-dependent methyltransferase [Microbispora]NJP27042.1 methyltransferase domain-containing protein [Microbispora sp. CL1-1]TQS11681.1 methyltransferase domain-containing protein [Microbispora sp. SCL1-1]
MNERIADSHRVFDRVSEEYDAARPHYPEALYVALENLSGVRLAGATVIDVGAGTGISTRGLLDRGARVVAVDRGERMLARLRARTACPALLADGNDLPFRAGVADLVTYAQAWHWLDPALSVAEAVRVIADGGAIAGWWNSVDPGKADWLAANQVRLAESCPGYIGPVLPGWSMPPIAAAMSDAGLAVADTWVGWTRSVRLEDFLTDLRSHSYMASMDGDVVTELLARERAELGRVFPDGRLTVPMRVYLAVGRRG